MNRSLIIAAGLAAVAAIAGLTLALVQRHGEAPSAATTLFQTPRTLPAFELVDQHGRALPGEAFHGRWDLLFFGFTHCPDICPTTLLNLKGVLARLDSLPPQRMPRVWMISVDPARDTPAVLADYVAFFDPRFGALTGTEDGVASIAAALGVAYAQIPEGDSYTIAHSAALFLVDPQGRYAGLLSTPHDWDLVAADLEKLAR